MFKKIFAVIEVIVGLGFFLSLISLLPLVGFVGDFLGSLLYKIPFYTMILILLGTVLFVDGFLRLFHH